MSVERILNHLSARKASAEYRLLIAYNDGEVLLESLVKDYVQRVCDEQVFLVHLPSDYFTTTIRS